MIAYQLVKTSTGVRSDMVTAQSVKSAAGVLSQLVDRGSVQPDDLVLILLESPDGNGEPGDTRVSRAPMLRVETVIAMFPNNNEASENV